LHGEEVLRYGHGIIFARRQEQAMDVILAFILFAAGCGVVFALVSCLPPSGMTAGGGGDHGGGHGHGSHH
jgi:hypothetical protein